ncbi:hypothetical protein JRO89_XS01G0150300 [Xanthoceras sorbifolium]|uniref:Retrotransposon gag domain-containing protein n=1 Tax=Xanthoceras sorbifolium TaxID=99658 RepID=A0ABQ8IKV5_9ROSI|nr:hypothetical protein JRO89_XS01G0150300 [Xanthoceras sorbifolium]
MTLTRYSNQGDFQFDLEIERTLCRLRREARRNFEENDLALDSLFASNFDLEEKKIMAGNQTLKELAAPDLNQQPLCITFPTLDATTTFELKSGLIHLLPTFHGLVGKDPHKHLKELHVVCTSMKSTGVTEEQIKLRAFPFSLKDWAKDWLYYLPSTSITTWNDMKRLFLEKYFPASRAASIRKEICGYFYEGLLPTDRSMIDAASGGVLVDKTPEAARNFIANMAANSQQFRTRLNSPAKNVNEVICKRQRLVGYVRWKGIQLICAQLFKKSLLSKLIRQLKTVQISSNISSHILLDNNRAKILILMGHMAIAINRLEAQSSGKLPSQTVVNPRENASAIVLRSGSEVEILVKTSPASSKQENEKSIVADRNIPNDDDISKHVHSSTLTMEFDGEIVKFNIYDAMKYPGDDNPVYSIDVIDSLAQEIFELDGKDGLEVAISKHLENKNKELALSNDLQETVAALNDFPKL